MLYREESTFRRMEDTSYRSNSTFLVCSPRSFRVEIRRGVRRILMYFLKKCTYVYIYTEEGGGGGEKAKESERERIEGRGATGEREGG